MSIVLDHRRVLVAQPFLDLTFRSSSQKRLAAKEMSKAVQSAMFETDIAAWRGERCSQRLDYVADQHFQPCAVAECRLEVRAIHSRRPHGNVVVAPAIEDGWDLARPPPLRCTCRGDTLASRDRSSATWTVLVRRSTSDQRRPAASLIRNPVCTA